jgi:hypothetical protein
MTSVTGMAMGDSDADSDERADRDPFGGSRIEVSDADLRRASPAAWFGGVVERIDEAATRLTYGRK